MEMTMSEAVPVKDRWGETARRAAVEAKWLRTLAITLFIVALIMILVDLAAARPIRDLFTGQNAEGFSLGAAVRSIGPQLIRLGPAIALAWALWEAQAYLKRVEAGEVWAASTMKLIERVGECLIVATVLAVFVSPTLDHWVTDTKGGVGLHLESTDIVLGGLGIILVSIAKVLGDMLKTAGDLKADSDAIV
jgi:hypothetical protein